VSEAEFQVFTRTLSAIPYGYYTSYGKLAGLCGVHVRQIQAWLRRLPRDTKLPWYRIINSQRRVTEHPGAATQRAKLSAEGLFPLSNGRYPPDRYWPDAGP